MKMNRRHFVAGLMATAAAGPVAHAAIHSAYPSVAVNGCVAPKSIVSFQNKLYAFTDSALFQFSASDDVTSWSPAVHLSGPITREPDIVSA